MTEKNLEEELQELETRFVSTLGKLREIIFRLEVLSPRSPTLRAPVDQATSEAIVADWATYAITEGGFNLEDAQKVTRFLRERLGRR